VTYPIKNRDVLDVRDLQHLFESKIQKIMAKVKERIESRKWLGALKCLKSK
jgi:hypothetical protein